VHGWTVPNPGPLRLIRRSPSRPPNGARHPQRAQAGGYRRGYGGKVRGVGRAAEVLALFSVERPYWGPTEVAAEVGVAKSSAYALLRELTRAGLLERMACGQYRLGWRLVGLARTMLQSNALSTAMPAARELARELGETVHLAALDRGNVLYVSSVVPALGVAAPAGLVAAELTPLGQVLSTGHRGVLVGPQRALDGVECAAVELRVRDEPAGSLGVCAPKERFAVHREMYARAVAATRRRVARAVRL
jgi:DNA-binding IclR family transcriptional regulator